VAKLSCFAPLSQAEIGVLEMLSSNEEHFRAHIDLLSEGDPPRSPFIVIRGMACRYRILADGRRQILTFLLPGDLCELHTYLLKAMDHSAVTLTPGRLAVIERATITTLIARYPRIGAAIWWCSMQEAAIMRERIVGLGRRSARGRVAYILCELVWRHREVGLAEGHTIRLPLTQTDIADTLGLTPVHVNRVLQQFRREGLITLAQRKLRLHDVERLQDLAELTEDYLHLAGMPAEAARYLDGLEHASQ
jgi:CRP-like cAMP-binding protein